jgi:hypothetical protein
MLHCNIWRCFPIESRTILKLKLIEIMYISARKNLQLDGVSCCKMSGRKLSICIRRSLGQQGLGQHVHIPRGSSWTWHGTPKSSSLLCDPMSRSSSFFRFVKSLGVRSQWNVHVCGLGRDDLYTLKESRVSGYLFQTLPLQTIGQLQVSWFILLQFQPPCRLSLTFAVPCIFFLKEKQKSLRWSYISSSCLCLASFNVHIRLKKMIKHANFPDWLRPPHNGRCNLFCFFLLHVSFFFPVFLLFHKKNMTPTSSGPGPEVAFSFLHLVSELAHSQRG